MARKFIKIEQLTGMVRAFHEQGKPMENSGQFEKTCFSISLYEFSNVHLLIAADERSSISAIAS